MWDVARRGSDKISQRPPAPREVVWTWSPLQNPLVLVMDVKNFYKFSWIISKISNEGQECRTQRSGRYRSQSGPLSPCCWVQGNTRETWNPWWDCFLEIRSVPQKMAEVQGVRGRWRAAFRRGTWACALDRTLQLSHWLALSCPWSQSGAFSLSLYWTCSGRTYACVQCHSWSVP